MYVIYIFKIMNQKLTGSIIRVPFTNQDNMGVITNFIVGDKNIEDEVVLKYLCELALGFILTSAIITLIAQICIQYKSLDKKIKETQIQQLESVKFYNRLLTKDRSCIFFRNCLAVIESILVTIGEYAGLDPDQKREKFIDEVEAINSKGTPARLLVNPNQGNICMHRKAMTLRIRSSCQADPIYKLESLYSTSKSVWERVIPDRFVVAFGQYTNINASIVIEKILEKEQVKNLDQLIAEKLYSVMDSNDISFNESIGVNTVPLETHILQTYNKQIIRSKINFTPNVPIDLSDSNEPLGKLLELQMQKLRQPGGLKSNKKRK